MFFPVAVLLLSALPTVYSHARITSPPIRAPGQNFQTTCGKPSFDSVSGDPTGHIEEQEPFNAGCHPTLCRGMLFSDQPASNVQKVTPGQAMSMGVDCTIPHGGPANVTLVDTTVGGAGAFIGSFLKTFDDFCPTSGVTPADQTNLQFNLPSAATIGNKCQKAGDCVVQLFWATPDLSQNYYYCIDVAFDNGANGAAAQPSATSSVAQTTEVAQTTASSSVSDTATTTSDPVSATDSVTASSTTDAQSTTSATTDASVAQTTPAAPVAQVTQTPPASSSGFVVIVTVTSTPVPTASAVGALNNAARRRHRILWW